MSPYYSRIFSYATSKLHQICNVFHFSRTRRTDRYTVELRWRQQHKTNYNSLRFKLHLLSRFYKSLLQQGLSIAMLQHDQFASLWYQYIRSLQRNSKTVGSLFQQNLAYMQTKFSDRVVMTTSVSQKMCAMVKLQLAIYCLLGLHIDILVHFHHFHLKWKLTACASCRNVNVNACKCKWKWSIITPHLLD